jgi:pyruvate dehydrogenase E2 component (dihydrolipoamide acetyltransferase)
MPNVRLRRKKDLSTFRRIALGTWSSPHDAQVHGTLDVRMDEAMRYLDEVRRATGTRLTVTHLVARAAAAALAEMPDANAMLRFGRIYLRDSIDMFLQVAITEDGKGEPGPHSPREARTGPPEGPKRSTAKVDLSGVTLRDVDRKTVTEIAAEMEAQVEAVRARKASDLETTRGLFRRLPLLVVGPVLRLTSFLCYTLNLRLPGMPRDPFGSMMITNIGSLGLDTAYVPLVPYSRVPIILAIGAVKEVPVAENGRVFSAKVMKVNVTFDHRFLDGFHAAVMSRVLRGWLENPRAHFAAAPAAPASQDGMRLAG